MKNTGNWKQIRIWTVLVLCLILLAGCGTTAPSGTESAEAGAETGAQEESQAEESAAGTETGAEAVPEGQETSVEEQDLEPQGPEFHIYCSSDVFRNRLQGYYPGYKRLNSRLGMIGETKVVWHMISPEDGDYRDILQEALEAQEQEIDFMVLSEEDLPVLAQSGYALSLEEDLGFTEEELSDQFPYTRELASDGDGVQRAATWQAVPGVFVYRRSIAEEVLGTDDPAEVQEMIADWELFAERAPEMTARKYFMLSGYMDAYKAYADGAETPWVQDGEIVISESLQDWMTMANDFTNHRQHHSTDLRSGEWYSDQTGSGKVFGFFTPAWSIHYTMQDSVEGSEDEDSAFGDYAVCMGPQPYHWEGIYLAAAEGTDNERLAADIIRTMTCTPEVLKQITLELSEFTNTQSGMEELASEECEDVFAQDLLGGQNPMPLYLEIAKELHVRPVTQYDTDLDAGFQVCAKNFFTGKMTRDAAITNFFKVAVKRHPELTYEGAEAN